MPADPESGPSWLNPDATPPKRLAWSGIKATPEKPLNIRDIKLGEYALSSDGTVWFPCPLCGHCAPASRHQAAGAGTDRLTLSPSLRCAMAGHPDNPCGAHYYVRDGMITDWQEDTRLPPRGYQSNAEKVRRPSE